MSPAETQVRIDELNKGNLTNLWMAALLNRLSEGKKFPKTPQELWGEKPPVTETSIDALVLAAKSIAAAQKADEEEAANPKKKKRPRTFYRPERE